MKMSVVRIEVLIISKKLSNLQAMINQKQLETWDILSIFVAW